MNAIQTNTNALTTTIKLKFSVILCMKQLIITPKEEKNDTKDTTKRKNLLIMHLKVSSKFYVLLCVCGDDLVFWQWMAL